MAMQILEEGPRNLVVKFDGAGPHTVDVSALTPPCSRIHILRIWEDLPTAGTTLSWDATVPVLAWQSGAHAESFDFEVFGGLNNNAGAGITGDVIYAGVASGTMVVHFKKMNTNFPN